MAAGMDVSRRIVGERQTHRIAWRAFVPSGSLCGMAKLNEDAVAEIRHSTIRRGSVTSLAKRFNVSRRAIRFVLDGQRRHGGRRIDALLWRDPAMGG